MSTVIYFKQETVYGLYKSNNYEIMICILAKLFFFLWRLQAQFF